MTKINLRDGEAIIKIDSAVTHDEGNPWNIGNDELVLTNQALCVVHKKGSGKIKNITRFPLEGVKIAGGMPQVNPARSANGEKQIHVHFKHGVEAFALGASDDDDHDTSLKSWFTSESEKVDRNATSWCDAIVRAVLSLPRTENTAAKEDGSSDTFSTSSSSGGANTPASTHANRKCVGCMAPLSGKVGSAVKCKYCDTEQVI
jgi:hypothetical protein